VTADTKPAADMVFPDGLDLIWTSENYHDFHNKFYGAPDMKVFDTAIFNALKPGGYFIVEDHAAEAASGARDTETLHRIDPELVKREVIAAGFKLVGSSDVLKNSNDPHTAKVFEMHGKTDKFLFKFQKIRLR
jgi:predicted methyltransferase